MSSAPPVRSLRHLDTAEIDALADVLVDCVDGGASVSFMAPLARERALAFWREVAAGVERGERIILVADDERGICGTVQLVLKLPENQPHRADLAKMLVHRRARRRGLASALIEAAAATARDCGRTLLVLDTVAGSDAERLYLRAGWRAAGTIPGYALDPAGAMCDATFYYLDLAR